MAGKQHDPRYKRMFSYPEMVRDLLIEYVREDWVRELDFSTLEKQNGSYVADDDRDRCAPFDGWPRMYTDERG